MTSVLRDPNTYFCKSYETNIVARHDMKYSQFSWKWELKKHNKPLQLKSRCLKMKVAC
jgi:hypothetical protein